MSYVIRMFYFCPTGEEADETIRELSDFDPNWGLFGNVGGIDAGRLAIRISDPHGEDQFAEFLASEGEELGREFHRCAKRRESVPLGVT